MEVDIAEVEAAKPARAPLFARKSTPEKPEKKEKEKEEKTEKEGEKKGPAATTPKAQANIMNFFGGKGKK